MNEIRLRLDLNAATFDTPAVGDQVAWVLRNLAESVQGMTLDDMADRSYTPVLDQNGDSVGHLDYSVESPESIALKMRRGLADQYRKFVKGMSTDQIKTTLEHALDFQTFPNQHRGIWTECLVQYLLDERISLEDIRHFYPELK